MYKSLERYTFMHSQYIIIIDHMNIFELITQDKKARRGVLHTHHGSVQTPFFMPIATRGVVKGAIEVSDLRNIGFELLLSNTYHLHLRPGSKYIQEKGGLTQFMQWNGPILTDSGGFQVLSLSKHRKISEQGVTFRSHIDGSIVELTPENVIDIQYELGIDIAMVLDECTPFPCTMEYAQRSMERTTRWAKRCKEHWEKIGANKTQHLFAIVQGSEDKDLREKSAKDLVNLDFPGYAIGGVVESSEKLNEIIEFTTPFLPNDKLRYVMGVGTPENILNAIERGIDMFDCVLPTRNARHGQMFTRHGEINLRNAQWTKSDNPIDEMCHCHTCKNYSVAYLRHLFTINDPLAMRLGSIHNLHFYHDMMYNARKHIESNSFHEFKEEFIEKRKEKTRTRGTQGLVKNKHHAT